MAGSQIASAVLEEKDLFYLLTELYDVRTKWKWIGLGLRLLESDLEAMSGSHLDCLKSMLSKWLKEIEPLPTWRALVDVLKSPVVGEKRKAQELLDKLCSSTAPSLPSREQSEANESDDDDSSDGSLISSLARPSLLSSIEKIAKAELKRKMQNKDFHFRTLVRKMHRHLSDTIQAPKDFDDFRVAVSYLPASQSGHHVLLSPDDRKEILAATSFSHIFVVLNQYWSSHQYGLLKYVVEEYGDDGLKEEMKVYVAEMDELEEEEDISHFSGVRLCSPRPDSVTMEVYLSGSQHTLQNSRHVQRSMASQCGLHPHTVRTSHSTTGSTALTLLVPYSVAGHVMAVLHGMPLAGDMLSRPVEERVVYTMDEAETEMFLPLHVSEPPAPTILYPGRREKRGSWDSSCTTSTGYETISKVSGDAVCVVENPSSQITMLTEVSQEKDKEMDDQHVNQPNKVAEKGTRAVCILGSVAPRPKESVVPHSPADLSDDRQVLTELSSMAMLNLKIDQPNKVEAKGTRAVCILGSVAPHPKESVVPQSPADLSDDDRQVLTELGLPQDKWDNLNALLALYNKAENSDVFSVQVSKPGMELSRSYILEQIEFLLKTSTKKHDGAVVHYYGNGKRNTGDWCFRDGYITFRDIANLYMEHSRGRVLTIMPDCHSSGHWVSECAEFLDEQGVKPCGHSATEKGILLKILASCKTGQDAAELCYTTRAMELRDDGYVYHLPEMELTAQQKTVGVDFTRVRCKKKHECGISSNSTWSTAGEVISERICLARGHNEGHPAWYYILLDNDAEKIGDFIHEMDITKEIVNLPKYGTVLKSGRGEDAPQEVKDWIYNYGYP